MSPPARRGVSATAVILVVGAVCAVVAHLLVGRAPQPHSEPTPVAGPADEAAEKPKFPAYIREPAGPPTVKTGLTDVHGRPVSVACATCHTTRPANAEARLGTDLKTFHQGLRGQHGGLACVACHNPAEGYGTLRLADGKSLPYSEVMHLCAQCHGPQYRDYTHGSHGGMAGHWDLSKGPRQRNNCTDCHDPHAPRYPTVAPARGPNDRLLRKGH